MSNKYYPAPKRRKVKPLPRSTKPATTSPVPTSPIVQQCQKCAQVEFVLHNGNALLTKASSIVEDEDVIMGELIDGRLFAVPFDSISYFVEV